jgi:tetratricopeptide (TPR) repeat protein
MRRWGKCLALHLGGVPPPIQSPVFDSNRETTQVRLRLACVPGLVNLRELKHRRSQSKAKPVEVRGGTTASQLQRAGRSDPRYVGMDSIESVGRGRRVLFRVAAMVLVPLMVFGAVEAGLRLAGYGYSTSFFKTIRINGEDFLVENDKFGWRFFPPEIARSPSPVRMRAHKTPGTCRIFLFGESAALGDPQPAFGAGRYLQALLHERYPDAKFEVVCAAMTAINSHAVLPIARECAKYEGDLWIIYMGNNEMIGPFGATSVFGSPSPALWQVRLSLALEKTGLGQFLLSLARQGTARNGPSWGGMRMWVENRLAPNDRHKEPVYQSFQRNLEDILRAGRASGVPMILSTVAVNLKDCAPFASLASGNLTTADRTEFDKLYSEATQAQQQGTLATAAQKFEQAAGLDPDWAELQFRWGQCLVGLTNATSALKHFELARDSDALPFRTDSRLNGIIVQSERRLAGPDLKFFDVASLFATNSPVGIPGEEAFYEHVHFNFEGNYRLALALAGCVVPLLPQRQTQHGSEEWATQETCDRDLGLTAWNRRDVYQDMIRRLRQAPFTGQADHAEIMKIWQARAEALQRQLNATNAEIARNVYHGAIGRWPDDFRLHWNYADFLEATRDRLGAVAEWKEVQALIPHYHVPYYEIGRLLALQGDAAEARTWLLRALALRPDLSEGWYELGRVQGGDGQFESALNSFERARQLVPNEPRYHAEMGKALVKLNRRNEAISQLQEAVRLGASSWEVHYLLGEQLAFADRIDEAGGEFEKALRLKPGYVMAHLNLGVTFVKQGHLQEARRQFEEVLRLDPTNQPAAEYLEKLQTSRR